MAEVVHETQQDFWRPPSPAVNEEVVVVRATGISTMADACPRCGSEFLLGSRFCHSCGGRRPEALSATARADAAEFANLWETTVFRVRAGVMSLPRLWHKVSFPDWLHYLHFHEIKRWVGLPTASLLAFIIGLGCVAGTLGVGLFYHSSDL